MRWDRKTETKIPNAPNGRILENMKHMTHMVMCQLTHFKKKIILWHKVFPGLCVLPCSVNTFSYSSSFPVISVSLGSWTLLWAHPISTCVLGMPAKSHSMPCTVSPNSAQVRQQIQLTKWEEYGNHLFRILASLFHFYMYHQLHGEQNRERYRPWPECCWASCRELFGLK